jgi:hypothetical protein
MILVSTLPKIDSRMIHIQLLQDDKSLFFSGFTRCLFLQSVGTLSSFKIFIGMSIED